MSKPVSFCPFEKLDPRRNFWFDPNTLLHLLGSQTLAPTRPTVLGQVCEWARFDCERAQLSKYVSPRCELGRSQGTSFFEVNKAV